MLSSKIASNRVHIPAIFTRQITQQRNAEIVAPVEGILQHHDGIAVGAIVADKTGITANIPHLISDLLLTIGIGYPGDILRLIAMLLIRMIDLRQRLTERAVCIAVQMRIEVANQIARVLYWLAAATILPRKAQSGVS